MELGDSMRGKVTLVTLGPTGTCHERARDRVHGLPGCRGLRCRIHRGFLRRPREDPRERKRVPDPVQRAPEGARGHRAILGRGVRGRHVHLPDEGSGGVAPPRGRAAQDARPRSRDCGLHRSEATGRRSSTSSRSRSSPPSFSPGATKRASPTSNTSPPTPTSSASLRRSVKSTPPGSSMAPRSGSPAK